MTSLDTILVTARSSKNECLYGAFDGKKEFDDMVDSALYNNTNVYAMENSGQR